VVTAKRKRGNVLELWEVALVKAMLARGGYYAPAL
jgi:hypothetical protein